MEKRIRQGLLYDYYGDLLTEHSKIIYEDVVNEDMTLSEIADKHGVTRQAVHDVIRRCDKALEEYENKLGLLALREQINMYCNRLKKADNIEDMQVIADNMMKLL